MKIFSEADPSSSCWPTNVWAIAAQRYLQNAAKAEREKLPTSDFWRKLAAKNLRRAAVAEVFMKQTSSKENI